MEWRLIRKCLRGLRGRCVSLLIKISKCLINGCSENWWCIDLTAFRRNWKNKCLPKTSAQFPVTSDSRKLVSEMIKKFDISIDGKEHEVKLIDATGQDCFWWCVDVASDEKFRQLRGCGNSSSKMQIALVCTAATSPSGWRLRIFMKNGCRSWKQSTNGPFR